ncbi:hypothetical protein PGB90_005451 [Kerria lacca]
MIPKLFLYSFVNSFKTDPPDDEEWEDLPKIKEVAEGPYYDQFDYNVTRNYTVIAGTPAELLCRVKFKPTDGNKTAPDPSPSAKPYPNHPTPKLT